MSDVNNTPKRKNRKLQIIDLTDEQFEFSDQGMHITGFVANDGRQWFSARIACDNLDLANVAQATSSLPYRDKAIIITNRDNDNRGVRHIMVSKSGLFRLIFKSRKSEAVEYQDWVFDTVLPAIYEQGGYISPSATSEQVVALAQQIEDLRQVNRWLGGKRGAGKFLESTLPKRDKG